MPLATEIHPVEGVLAESTADRLVLVVRSGPDGPQPVLDGVGLNPADLDARFPAPVAQLFDTYEFSGKPGQVTEFPVDLGRGLVRLSFLGIGDATPGEMRRAGAALAGAEVEVGMHVALGRATGVVDGDGALALCPGLGLFPDRLENGDVQPVVAEEVVAGHALTIWRTASNTARIGDCVAPQEPLL